MRLFSHRTVAVLAAAIVSIIALALTNAAAWAAAKVDSGGNGFPTTLSSGGTNWALVGAIIAAAVVAVAIVFALLRSRSRRSRIAVATAAPSEPALSAVTTGVSADEPEVRRKAA